jgi:phosphatidate cytidylyltransferase
MEGCKLRVDLPLVQIFWPLHADEQGVTRILSAVGLLIPAFLVTRYLPPVAFFALIGLFLILGVLEFCALAARRGYAAQKSTVVVASLALAYAFLHPDQHVLPVLALILVVVPVLSLFRRDDMQQKFGNLVMTLFPVLYVGLLTGYLVGLRVLPGAEGHDLPFLLLFVVAAGDTGAYYGGRALGRHPLAPRLSPNKTWEGLAFGIAAAILAAFVARGWFIYGLTIADCVAIGVLLALVGSAGDLVESTLKRWAGAKDSSHIIPGHGGVLDRMDALLFAAPVLFYYHQFMRMAAW